MIEKKAVTGKISLNFNLDCFTGISLNNYNELKNAKR